MKSLKIVSLLVGFLFSMIVGSTVGAAYDSFAASIIVTGILCSASLFVSLPAGVMATTTCGLISSSIDKNCLDPNVTGINDRIILINYDDIDTITYNSSNKLIIEGITLVTASPAKAAYYVDGMNFSNLQKNMMQRSGPRFEYDHNITFKIFDNNPTVKAWIDNAMGGRFVVIIENNYDNENATTQASSSVYEVLGAKYGLEILSAENDKDNKEVGNGWILTLGCNENIKEQTPPHTFFITDKATTAAAIAALL